LTELTRSVCADHCFSQETPWLSADGYRYTSSIDSFQNGHNVTRRSNENGVYGCATCFQTSSREVSIAPFLRSYPFIVAAGP